MFEKSLFTEKDIAAYPGIAELLRECSLRNDGQPPGLCKEYSDTIARASGVPAKGFYVPLKAMNVASATAGGFLVGADVLPTVDVLRARSVCLSLGAIRLDNLKANGVVPNAASDIPITWGNETALAGTDEITFSQKSLVPHRAWSLLRYSSQMFKQTGGGAERFFRQALTEAAATAIDKAALAGTGMEQPIGLVNRPTIPSFAWGAAATWEGITAREKDLGDANADTGTVAWVTSHAVRNKWKDTFRTGSTSRYLWENDAVNGYPAISTKQLADTDRTIHGNFEDLVIALFGEGIDILVDTFTKKKTGEVEIMVNIHCDVGVMHETSFKISTDSGAQ